MKRLLNTMIESIKEYLSERKVKSQMRDEANLREEFEVVERGGCLWLTHCGVAFMKINSVSYAADVSSELKTARDTAVEFAQL